MVAAIWNTFPPQLVSPFSHLCPSGCVYANELRKYFSTGLPGSTPATPTLKTNSHTLTAEKMKNTHALLCFLICFVSTQVLSLPNVRKLQLVWPDRNMDSSCSCMHVHMYACAHMLGHVKIQQGSTKQSSILLCLELVRWPFKVPAIVYDRYSCVYKILTTGICPSGLKKFKINCNVWNGVNLFELQRGAGHRGRSVSGARMYNVTGLLLDTESLVGGSVSNCAQMKSTRVHIDIKG